MADLEKLDNAINELEKQSNELKDFNSVYAEIAKLKQDILENLKLLKENNEGLADISKAVEKRLEESQKKIDEIYKDNKAFQKELDGSITSRLEKHNSDIQVEIRNVATQLQRSIETVLNSNFNEMETKQKDSFDRQAKQLNFLKTMTYIIITLSIGILVALFLIA
jgi:chromosome segregation ATPase